MSVKPKPITSVDDLTPDALNANRHTQRGLAMMETSLREGGYGDSVTVDREGRVISGNGRVETLASIGMTDAIVVQSDGTRPIIHQRTDLDLTTDERAKRLALLQNRTGQINLEWDAQVLVELAATGTELDDLFAPDELNALLGDLAQPVAGAGGDEFDSTPTDGPTRVQSGEVWRIGPHRIVCGDCTDAATVERVMEGGKAALILADPPYFGKVDDKWDNDFEGYEGFLAFLDSVFSVWAALMLDRGTAAWWCAPDYAWHIEGLLRKYFAVFNHVVWYKGQGLGTTVSIDEMRRWRPRSERLLLCEMQHSPDALLASFNAKTAHIAARSAYSGLIDRLMAWREEAGLTNAEIDAALGTHGMAGHYFGKSQWALPTEEAWGVLRPLFASRGIEIGEFDAQRSEFDAQRREFDAQRREFDAQRVDGCTDVWEASAPVGDDRFGHPTPKPVALFSKIIDAHSRPDDLVSDPFLGSGTTLVAAHRLGRICYGCEIEPRYCDVILRRAEAEGIGPIERIDG